MRSDTLAKHGLLDWHFEQDAALHKIVSQHQTTLRTKLRRLEEQQLQASAAKPEGGDAAEEEDKATSAPAVTEEKVDTPPRAAPPPGAKFISIDTFAWDQVVNRSLVMARVILSCHSHDGFC
jgi:hypothetical protein